MRRDPVTTFDPTPFLHKDGGAPGGHCLPADAVSAVLATPISEVPVQVDGDGFPRRIGDQTVQSSESQIQAFKLHGLAEIWESRPSLLALTVLDPELVHRARRGAGRDGASA